jgi:hypothetical protein
LCNKKAALFSCLQAAVLIRSAVLGEAVKSFIDC